MAAPRLAHLGHVLAGPPSDGPRTATAPDLTDDAAARACPVAAAARACPVAATSDAPDVIIVGSGAAGGVMASRLSEDPEVSVLLLEAGPDYGADGADLQESLPLENKLGFAPGVGVKLPRSAWDPEGSGWSYTARTGGAADREVALPRGKLIGGSTSVNSQMWVRGVKEDFEHWAADLGCDSWGFENCLPFFNVVEADRDHGEEDYHGADGPIRVLRIPESEWRTTDHAFHKAAIAHGFADERDINRPDTQGGVGTANCNLMPTLF